jgi:hypothetical protein
MQTMWSKEDESSAANVEKYGNTYQVRRIHNMEDDIGGRRVSKLKEYLERQDWMKSEDDWKPKSKSEKVQEIEIEILEKENLQDRILCHRQRSRKVEKEEDTRANESENMDVE